MLTDQWYVRADVLAKPAVEAVENGDIQFVRSSTKTCFSGCVISGLVYLSSVVVGVTVSRHGTTTATSALAVPKQCVRKITSAPTLRFVGTNVLDTGSPPRCGLSPPSAARKHTDALRQFHPTSVMVSGFDIIFFWIARMMAMALHQKMKTASRRCVPYRLYDRSDSRRRRPKMANPRVTLSTAGYGGRHPAGTAGKRAGNMMQPQMAEKILKAYREAVPERH